MRNTEKSKLLFQRAAKVLPGGVNSPVRAFKSVGGEPIFFERAEGAYLFDADGNKYIDFVGSWGPMIVGFSHPQVIDAIRETAQKAVSFGASTELEIDLAEKVIDMVPSIEMVRMVNSGTEATMSAIRLARGYTGRHKIIKFSGCYHGHADSFLIQAGSGATTLGVPNSPGVTPGSAADTLIAQYNNMPSVQRLIDENPAEIAAIIVEPIAGNMGLVLPKDNFLQQLRDVCTKNGIVLIFDEVMTGFRVARGGVQERYGVTPDMTTLGKIIGGGLPVGAYGGKKEIMEMVAPVGPVYQAGTLSGNPLAMRAGLETLKLIDQPGFYESLESKSAKLANGVRQNMEKLGVDFYQSRCGSMGCLFFYPEPVHDYETAVKSDTAAYGVYFNALLQNGVYFAPAQFEAFFVSAAHSDDDIEKTIEANFNALQKAISK